MVHRWLVAPVLLVAGLVFPACVASGNGGLDAMRKSSVDGGGSGAADGGLATPTVGALDGTTGVLYFTYASMLVRRDLATKQELSVQLHPSSSEYFGFGGGVFTEYVNRYPDVYSYAITLHQFEGTKFTARSLPSLEVPRGRVTSMIQPSPDARRFLVATTERDELGEEETAYVRVIDDKLTVSKTITGFALPTWLDGHTIVLRGPGGLYRADLDSEAAPVRIGPTFPSPVADVSVSPDGKTLAFVIDDAVYRMDLDGSGLLQLTLPSVEERWPAFSPDGSALVLQHGVCDGTVARVVVISASQPNQDVAASTHLGLGACGPMRWM